MKSKYIILFPLLFLGINTIAQINIQNNSQKYGLYENQDLGITFNYPLNYTNSEILYISNTQGDTIGFESTLSFGMESLTVLFTQSVKASCRKNFSSQVELVTERNQSYFTSGKGKKLEVPVNVRELIFCYKGQKFSIIQKSILSSKSVVELIKSSISKL